jgi:hypothetical protein
MDEKPRFAHDCERCTFLGRFDEYDLYFCGSTVSVTGTTVIARWGNDGPEYSSGLELAQAGKCPELIEAMSRAQDRGLLPKPRVGTEKKQYIRLYIDKIRGYSRFEADPLPPLREYLEAVTIWQEEAARNLQPLVGKIFSPNIVACILAGSRSAIQLARARTGMLLEFEHYLTSPGDFDDRGFNEGRPKTAYEVLLEAELKRRGEYR